MVQIISGGMARSAKSLLDPLLELGVTTDDPTFDLDFGVRRIGVSQLDDVRHRTDPRKSTHEFIRCDVDSDGNLPVRDISRY